MSRLLPLRCLTARFQAALIEGNPTSVMASSDWSSRYLTESDMTHFPNMSRVRGGMIVEGKVSWQGEKQVGDCRRRLEWAMT